MAKVQVPVRDLGRYERALAKGIVPALSKAVREGGREALSWLREETQRYKKVDLAAYLHGWDFEPLRGGGGQFTSAAAGVVVLNRAPHAIFVERGRRAGARQPPVEALRGWAERHGVPVWPLVRAIARRGIKPCPILTGPRGRMHVRMRIDGAALRALDALLKNPG